MKVVAIRNFVGIVQHVKRTYEEGQEFDLPDGVDWIQAGLVAPVRAEKVETATRKAPEKAVTREAPQKKAVDKVMRTTKK